MTIWIILAHLWQVLGLQMLLVYDHLTGVVTIDVIMFAKAGLVNPACIQTVTKADQHSDGHGVWGNVSALITHLFWEREGKRPTKMKSEKVTSAPWLKWLLRMYCKFLSNISLFLSVFLILWILVWIWVIIACRSSHQSAIESVLACLADRQNGPCHSGRTVTWRRGQRGKERRTKGGREGGSDESTDGSDIAEWCAVLKTLMLC